MKAKSLLELILAFFRSHGSITNTHMEPASHSPAIETTATSAPADATQTSEPSPATQESTVVSQSCEDGQYSRVELAQYEQAVKMAIREGSDDLFPNQSQAHAAIVIREFIKAAREYIHVYCGKLSSNVYGNLLPHIREAEERGVDVKFIVNCESGKEEASELAIFLQEKKQLKNQTQELDVSHFSVFDGQMFRLETDKTRSRALVCASATSSGNIEMVRLMDAVFHRLWEQSTIHS